MSRNPHDFYETPAWATESIIPFLKTLVPKPNRILDPGAGTGAITKVLRLEYPATLIHAVEIQKQFDGKIEGATHWYIADFLQWTGWNQGKKKGFDLCVGNPPYRGPAGEDYAMQFVLKARRESRVVCFLLRLSFLGSKKRSRWFLEDPTNRPHVAVLAKRPSYDMAGTDATESAWMIWCDEDVHAGLSGTWTILPPPGSEGQQIITMEPASNIE